MNLKGTLADFAVADVLQLVAKQAQSGILHLRRRNERIHLAITNGFVVSAVHSERKEGERLGDLLVRADLLSPDDLARALAVQKGSQRRLGDVLVELELVPLRVLKEMLELQTLETACRLFAWRSGSYEFEPGAVEWDPATVAPISAEAILEEGHRRVEEWPRIQKRVPSPATTFRRRPSPPLAAEDAALSPLERSVLGLAEPGRTAERISDLSRAGAFETSRALAALVNRGLLEAVAPVGAAAGVGQRARGVGGMLASGAGRLAGTLALAALLAGLAWLAAESGRAGVEGRARPHLGDHAVQGLVARHRLARLRAALEVWRVERGEYPAALDELVKAGLAAPAELRRPYPEEYYYRRTEDGGVVLLPPLP